MAAGFFIKGISYSYIRQIVALINTIFSLPLLLGYLGSVNYGIWVLILGLTGYMQTISFGIPSAMTTLVANTSNLREKYEILKKSVFLIFIITVFFLIFFVFFIINDDSWILFFLGDIESEYSEITKFIFKFFVIFTLLKLPFDLFIQFFSGMGDVHNSQIYLIIKLVVNFLVVLVAVSFELNVSFFVLVWLISDLIISVFSVFHVVCKYSYIRKVGVTSVTIKNKDIIKSGFAFFQVGIAASIVWSTDNLIISHFLTLELITPYSIAFKMFAYLFMFSSSVNAVVTPMYGNAYAKRDFEKIRLISNLVYKTLPFVAALGWFFLILFSKELVILWVGKKDAFGGYLLFFSLGLYGYVLSFLNSYATLLYSLNFAKKVYFLAWSEALLNFILSLLFIQILGIGGVALATALSALVISFMLPKLIGRLLNNEVRYDYSYLLKQFFLLILPSLIVCLIFKEELVFYKIFVFVIIVLFSVLISWKLLSDKDRASLFLFFK